MVKLAVTLHEVQHLFGGDPKSLIEVARLAEAEGMDHIILGEHLIVTGEGATKYPSGVPIVPDYECYEPLILLAAIAAATSRIRLSTGILIGPLRPAILLAKQAATLDQLCGGRLDLGLGVGWQEDEYKAAGVPFEGRFGRLEEQVRACKALWRDSPAAFHGKTVAFQDAYSQPFPAQGAHLPIWLGFALGERNVARVAELADGWIATSSRDHSADFRDNVARLKAAFEERGRDPDTLAVCLTPNVVRARDGEPNLEATLAEAQGHIDDGATILTYRPNVFCRKAEDLPGFFAKLRQLKPA